MDLHVCCKGEEPWRFVTMSVVRTLEKSEVNIRSESLDYFLTRVFDLRRRVSHSSIFKHVFSD
jgi:hypothetical protein